MPDALRTEELEDITVWLGELVRQVDSSLLDEWAQLTAGGDLAPEPPPQLTRNTRAFRVLVRNAMWQQVQLIAQGTLAARHRVPVPADRHRCRRPRARLLPDRRSSVIQVLKDLEGDHDWASAPSST